MAYIDTSVLVAATTAESRTRSVQRWLADQPLDQLCISDWTTTEFSAALSMKLRMGHLDEAARAEVLSAFATMARDSFTVIPVTRDDFSAAARRADHHGTGLRAGGALHLAIAANAGETIVSLDRGMIKAALAAGIRARLP